jgi:CDP-diacylglycerol---glycerol-3-phosphate 3-phosphatidyltransferase
MGQTRQKDIISLFRTLLCLVVVALLFTPSQPVYLACFMLTVAVIWMDGLDGYVARKFNESSKGGAVMDILCDRIVEQVYWITFLGLGWVPLWIPLVVIIRGVAVDGLRSMALEQGYTAFGKTTMMQSKLGVLLVSSNASRWLYAFAKAVAFSFLILAHTPGLDPAVADPVWVVAQISVYIAVVFCVIRGLPVLVEGRRFFSRTASSQG